MSVHLIRTVRVLSIIRTQYCTLSTVHSLVQYCTSAVPYSDLEQQRLLEETKDVEAKLSVRTAMPVFVLKYCVQYCIETVLY